jgi:hypothetical protein
MFDYLGQDPKTSATKNSTNKKTDWGYGVYPPGVKPPPGYPPPSKGNCTRFGFCDPKKDNEPHSIFPPGWDKKSGLNSCDQIKTAALKISGITLPCKGKDGKPCCPKDCKFVAFGITVEPRVQNGRPWQDFHWWRKNAKTGNWDHKPGSSYERDTDDYTAQYKKPVKREVYQDKQGKPVTDPSKQSGEYMYCFTLCVKGGIDTDKFK